MLRIIHRRESIDGSVKYVFLNECENTKFETLYFRLPFQTTEGYSYTICISSQAGCALKCAFCATGAGGFKSQLTPDDMHEQIKLVREDLIEKKIHDPSDRFQVALMGMGEPLLNYNNVIECCKFLKTSYPNLNKISLSTVGIVPQILMLANNNEIDIDLFVSIHSPYNEQRSSIIPVNKKYPLQLLLNSCKEYAMKKNTFVNASYMLISGVNDSIKHAEDFCNLLSPKEFFRVQILLYNQVDSNSYERPLIETAERFKEITEKNHLNTMIIVSKARDIYGGCGQLETRES